MRIKVVSPFSIRLTDHYFAAARTSRQSDTTQPAQMCSNGNRLTVQARKVIYFLGFRRTLLAGVVTSNTSLRALTGISWSYT
jgi:hypothetical protein